MLLKKTVSKPLLTVLYHTFFFVEDYVATYVAVVSRHANSYPSSKSMHRNNELVHAEMFQAQFFS